MTNPFAQPAQQPAAAPEQPAVNPYAPQQPQQAPAAGGNPFGNGVPTQPAAAPQGNPYAQPQQPAAAPQYLGQPGPAAPGYAQPQAQPTYAPAAVAPQHSAPPALNIGSLQSAGAPVVGSGRGAQLADMYGRLVLIFPLSLTRVPRKAEHVTAEQRSRGDLDQEQLTATVVVLDDGNGGMQPIAFGGKPYALPPTPHTDSAPLPYVRKAMWLKQSRLISQLRDFLPQGGGVPGMICGRVVKAGPEHNAPWFLQGATEQELGLAGKYLELVQQGVYEHPLA